MVGPALARLEQVDLRSIWATEARDFTPWLAEEDNLRELSGFGSNWHRRCCVATRIRGIFSTSRRRDQSFNTCVGCY